MVNSLKYSWSPELEVESIPFDAELEFQSPKPAVPLQLELYPIEATRPPNTDTLRAKGFSCKGDDAKHEHYEPVVLDAKQKNKEGDAHHSPRKTNVTYYNKNYQKELDGRSFKSYPFDFTSARIVRKNLYNIEQNPSKLLVPLQLELNNLDYYALTQSAPFTLAEEMQGRRFLIVSKSEDQNKISLTFSIGDANPESSCNEGQLIISLLARQVNVATFENWDLNRYNHDESNDTWCEKYFITLVEFLKIMEFSIGDKFAIKGSDKNDGNKEGFDAYEKKRIRSNIREFLTGKTLSSSLPQHILDPMLPSQKDFVFGMYRQINQYSFRRPAFSYKTVALMKLEDVEKAIAKCTQFLSFEVSLE